jgi:Flp pilus assembly protein TadD
MSDVVKLYDEADQLKAEGNLEGAAAKLKDALAIDESYEEAIQHAKRVAELEPQDPFSYTALSVTYQRAYVGTNELGYIRLAEEAMERSRMLGPRR